MSPDEIKVLEFVGCNMGGPENIKEALRPTYMDLMERGFIKTYVVFHLSDEAQKIVDDDWARRSGAPTST